MTCLHYFRDIETSSEASIEEISNEFENEQDSDHSVEYEERRDENVERDEGSGVGKVQDGNQINQVNNENMNVHTSMNSKWKEFSC